MLWLALLIPLLGCGTRDAKEMPCQDNLFAQTVIPDNEKPKIFQEDKDYMSMLSYYQWLKQCTGGELRQEYERVVNGRTPDGELRDRVRLALLLSLPNKPFRDDQRAMTLLHGYLHSGGPRRKDDMAFAMMLMDILNERERHRTVSDQLRQQTQTYHSIVEELHKERALRRDLQGQMDQLKEIEENIIEREQSVKDPLKENNLDVEKSQNTSGR